MSLQDTIEVPPVEVETPMVVEETPIVDASLAEIDGDAAQLQQEVPVSDVVEGVETGLEASTSSETEEAAQSDANAADEGGETEAEAIKGDVSADAEVSPDAEPFVIDPNADATAVLEAVKPVIDKYELPDELNTAITALIAKAEGTPGLAEYADYGDAEAIKALLDRQSHLDTAREADNGQYRPNTDKFVEQIKGTDTAGWLWYDLGTQPSTEYTGLNKFQETIVNVFAKDDETPAQVISRYERLVEHLSAGTFPDDGRPAFIPDNLSEAFSKLSPSTREELGALDPAYDGDKELIDAKLAELAMMQDGLNGKKLEARRNTLTKAEQQQAIQQEVLTTQSNFFTTFRDSAAKDLAKSVQFHTDAKMQNLLANQQVSLLSEAFSDGPDGDFARNTLKDAGIQFDYAKAQQLMKDIERCSVQLVAHKRAVDTQGKPLDPVSLNKAKSEFERTGRAWQEFAKNIIAQEARLVSTGTAEAIKTAAEKIRVAPKARQVPKGSPSAATNNTTKLAPMGSEKRYDQIAEMELARAAKMAEMYQ